MGDREMKRTQSLTDGDIYGLTSVRRSPAIPVLSFPPRFPARRSVPCPDLRSDGCRRRGPIDRSSERDLPPTLSIGRKAKEHGTEGYASEKRDAMVGPASVSCHSGEL
jgi:hypothetical protein